MLTTKQLELARPQAEIEVVSVQCQIIERFPFNMLLPPSEPILSRQGREFLETFLADFLAISGSCREVAECFSGKIHFVLVLKGFGEFVCQKRVAEKLPRQKKTRN